MSTKNIKASFSASSTILNGQTAGSSVEVSNTVRGVVLFPSGFDGTAIKWDVSDDGATWFPLFSGGSAVSTTVSATQAAEIPAGAMAGRFMRPVAATAQTGDSTLSFSLSF